MDARALSVHLGVGYGHAAGAWLLSELLYLITPACARQYSRAVRQENLLGQRRPRCIMLDIVNYNLAWAYYTADNTQIRRPAMWEAALPESLLARAAIAYVYSLIAAAWMYYTARKSAPGLSRLVWALPVVLTELAVAPVLVDPVRWPILPTPVSGIFGLAAFKVSGPGMQLAYDPSNVASSTYLNGMCG